MIEIIKEVKDNWYLIHLQGTRYYQIWQKWELFELLLDHKSSSVVTLWDEDFPMTQEDIESLVEKLDIRLKEKTEQKINQKINQK